MAGIVKADPSIRAYRKAVSWFYRLEKGQTSFSVRHGVKGFDTLLPGADLFSASPFRLYFLDVGAVAEHDLAKFKSGLGAKDLSFEAFLDGPGDEAGVINMGMGQKDGLDVRGFVAPEGGVSFFYFLAALEHAAIDQQARSFVFHQKARTRDGPGGS
jgi:hypothetical protein